MKNVVHKPLIKPSKDLPPPIHINPLNAELNSICYLLALLAYHFLHVSRIRVKSLTLRLLISYIYDISSLRVKLGLMKNFVKTVDVKIPAFTYLCGKFPRLTFEKVKAGVFIGPQIRQIF